MLNYGKKIRALHNYKPKNILTPVLSEKKFLNETKNHNPPLQVKWSVPKTIKENKKYVVIISFLFPP